MLTRDPFATFNPTPYLTAPQFPLHTLAVLSKALSRRMPGDPPVFVAQAEVSMRTMTEDAEQVMVARLRETNKGQLKLDLALDNALDGLWSLSRERLLGWARYERPGLDFLVTDEKLELNFEEVRAKARRAGELARKLFGEGPLEMLSKSYPEQAQLMANVLRLVKHDGLEAELIELSGEELLPILRRCQVAYVDMVDRRAGDASKARTDLGVARQLLGRQIVQYNTMVMAMLDIEKPQTQALVETALLPMVAMRKMFGKKPGAGEAELPLSEAEAELIAEIEAELEAEIDNLANIASEGE